MIVFHCTVQCFAATVTEIRCFEQKKPKTVLGYRCSTCRQSNISPSLQEALDDINKKFGGFINKFSQIQDRLKNVEKVTFSVPALNKGVEYLNSDRFNEGIISDAMQRIEKSCA